jgi:hypothetical protein
MKENLIKITPNLIVILILDHQKKALIKSMKKSLTLSKINSNSLPSMSKKIKNKNPSISSNKAGEPKHLT